MEPLKYDVFISYSRKDYVDEQKNVIPDNAISRIMDALKKAGISYWFDKEGIYSGNEFTDKIVTNIEASSVLLFLSTKNANSSQWTSKEIACADELHKYIIPVRVDHSPYNKKVLFRIADRSYIDFEANPDKGLCEIVQSIELYKEQLETERKKVEEAERRRKEMEMKKAEELRLKNEREEKRRKQEQDRIIKDIKISYATLNNEEAKLELDRKNLLINAEKVTDNEQRIQLIELIKTGGAIHQKYQGVVSELTNELQAFKSIDIESLKKQLNGKDQKISSLESDLNTSKAHEETQERAIYRLNGQLDDLQKQIIDLQKKPDNKGKKNKLGVSLWGHITYITLLIGAIVWLTTVYGESKTWESRYKQKRNECVNLTKAKESLSSISDLTPIVIKNVEVKNSGEEWGDDIYSSKSTYIHSRIQYIGISSGTYTLSIKFFDKNGQLSRNEEISPKGYTYSCDLTIEEGTHVSDTILGWGNETPGNWPAGIYRIEIWYKEMMLFQKSFKVL